MIVYAHPGPPRGAHRDRHETWAGDAVAADVPQRASGPPTNGTLADVKTRGPGAPKLAPSAAVTMIPPCDGGYKPDTGEIAL